MILRRLGNKSRLLPKLLALFPENITCFIDLFMGSGAVTFAMVDRAKYIIANDNDADIFNLFLVVKERRQELIDALTLMPIHDALFQHWRKTEEADPVWQAGRFLFLSNFSYLGAGDTLSIGQTHAKDLLLRNISALFAQVQTVKFTCCDFRAVLPSIHWRYDRDKTQAFIYADPPYLGTDNNYQDGFTEQDTRDLFDVLTGSGIRFALSEFAHPLVMELAQAHGLQVTELGERQTLKSRQTELLITNYDTARRQLKLW